MDPLSIFQSPRHLTTDNPGKVGIPSNMKSSPVPWGNWWEHEPHLEERWAGGTPLRLRNVGSMDFPRSLRLGSSTLGTWLAYGRGKRVWDILLHLSTYPSWCSHGAFVSEENLLARLAMEWKLGQKERRRECFYVSNFAERRGKMKTEKWPWNLATWKSLVTGAILGKWWSESLVRIGDVIFKNLPHFKRW